MGKNKSQVLEAWRGFRSSRLYQIRGRFELYPIVACVAAVVTGGIATAIHSMFKLDVSINKYAPPRHDGIDLMNPQKKKLVVTNDKYEPMPELHNLLQEIKEEELKQGKVDVEDDGVTRRRV
ncbi:hypothetical protein J437_LFUL006114 [Ladona fulva]|uniref:Uncharacterized protein n=1 Tax=Ladona fulva TaxID=123851 RepID=A0A8K0P225_LADFU|nr:hypothetical protein J437_LFUL006114 [Ladona fulva]